MFEKREMTTALEVVLAVFVHSKKKKKKTDTQVNEGKPRLRGTSFRAAHG